MVTPDARTRNSSDFSQNTNLPLHESIIAYYTPKILHFIFHFHRRGIHLIHEKNKIPPNFFCIKS
jgi:hypothetical protein